MRGARECVCLLTRSQAALWPTAAGTGPLAAAVAPPVAAAPTAAAAAMLLQELAALRRCLHSSRSFLCCRHRVRQKEQHQLRCLQQRPEELCSLRRLSSRPRGRKDFYDNVGKKNTEQLWYILAAAVGMVGATYAAVPLYRMFCQATGYGGTVIEGKAVEDKIRRRQHSPDPNVEQAAAQRQLTVYFNSDVADGMPWRFVPTQRSVRLHPGQSTLAFYTAENQCDKAVTGVSTYNVAPQQAGQYFNKIQCFCFEEQKLRPGERVDMPVFFYIDPEFACDPKMKGINTITLSYTFFKVAEEEYEEEEGVAAVADSTRLAVSAASQ